MFGIARRRRRRSTGSPLEEGPWQKVFARYPFLAALAPSERRRLHSLAGQFLRTVTLEGAASLLIEDTIRATIASQACLLILNLGMDYYRDCSAIILYPGEFRVHREDRDEAGVVHENNHILSGESWQRGPVVLSWRAAAELPAAGHNVVLHEFAHKIDMLNGKANGFPPLHAGMDAGQWTLDFSTAYAGLCRRLDAGETPHIGAYAATDPGEFFAVASETFFTEPGILREEFPGVYGQLTRFYRQDPNSRRPGLQR
ncbi:MAG: M90 family metallopeptidase [Acidiferrobacterales bacterium]